MVVALTIALAAMFASGFVLGALIFYEEVQRLLVALRFQQERVTHVRCVCGCSVVRHYATGGVEGCRDCPCEWFTKSEEAA